MLLNRIYASILGRKACWNYYNTSLEAPNIKDVEDCYLFITTFLEYSGKTKTVLFNEIGFLKEHCPERLRHIVSAFFLGLWLFRHRTKFVYHSIMNELKGLNCFKNRNNDEIESQFTYVWFMATLFHDLGYKSEILNKREPKPRHSIPEYDKLGFPYRSVPDFYKKIYPKYYAYREEKEHGIFAGLTFDRDLTAIRRFQENSSSKLDWSEELEELYHYVGWIIASHNIWLIRVDSPNYKKYKENALDDLILSSRMDKQGQYLEYKFRFEDYSLFSLFCIIDTIEPWKLDFWPFKVDIRLKNKKMIIKSDNSNYLDKINELKDWLCPVIREDDCVTIYFDNIV